ncbi:MAG: Peptidase M23 [Candidatus Woesebacteria bacterium GW2011_GWA2_40_7]|uniref:Peptidase M23 n=3 Tax=Candidatus Woeseibacteriota TaxID=1752722 RepID=A0A0G0PS37_9BACT|nr:MAG: Peptidase M23 [Candidatus Woesebacteria bacterium GW2011_GWB1_39_10]KKR73587.1 MAG: Peptidase M23 [Candidatus Woesebacteria bacterium GW2011_GWA2_40_7]KKS91111.1 MAG: Peptidase M23 [Candidatus Woesebacteria bacterium GW2011_GWA1_43_12]
MKKFSLELPKYRLAMHFRLIKRRKPLLVEPIVPTVAIVNKKYKKGTLAGKFIRHVSGHKNARRIMAGNFAAFAVITSFLPFNQASNVNAFESSTLPDQVIIEPKNTLETQKGTQFPLTQFKINQSFSFFHPGIDLGSEVGNSVKPIKAGEVVEAGYATDGYGNTIVIDHGKGLLSRYAHLSKIEKKIGETVTTDDEIGKVGLTGRTTGPHLHLEIRQDGVPLNPFSIIPR